MTAADGVHHGQAPEAGLVQRYWTGIKLWKRILLALLLGIVAGWLLGDQVQAISWMGELFMRLVRMLVVPLVFVVIVSGVAALGNLKQLGSIGVKSVALYALMMGFAVTIGLVVATLFQPGAGVVLASAPATLVVPPSLREVFLGIVPLNPVKSLAEGEMLSIIFFAIFVGIGMIVAGERARPLMQLFDAASAVMLHMVQIVMEFAPFGVFALIAVVVGNSGFAAFSSILLLAACVITGSAIQTLLVHGGLVRLGAWLPVGPFFRGITDAVLVGFSTASSSASLPAVMTVAERNLGIGLPVRSTVLPLGVTIGMDGAGMYIAILSVFAAQAFGIALAPGDYLVLLVTIVAIAMGTAPIPSASLFLLAAVLAGIGVSPEHAALLVGFILPFDRPLDMIRTVPNVTSDLAVATTVARWEDQLDLETYRADALHAEAGTP